MDDAKGFGLWGGPLTRERLAACQDWDSKAPTHLLNQPWQAGVSRHHAGTDLRGVGLQTGNGGHAGRRVTDVTGWSQTDTDPDWAAYAHSHATQLPLSLRKPRRSGLIHGLPNEQPAGAASNIYGSSYYAQRSQPQPQLEALHEPCFFLGDTSESDGPPRQESSSEWRLGDVRPFQLGDTSAPVPPGTVSEATVASEPSAHHRRQPEPVRGSAEEEARLGAIVGVYTAVHKLSHGNGKKLTDVHEGWQGLHRDDPPEPSWQSYRRSLSDINLHRERRTGAHLDSSSGLVPKDAEATMAITRMPLAPMPRQHPVVHGRRQTSITCESPAVTDLMTDELGLPARKVVADGKPRPNGLAQTDIHSVTSEERMWQKEQSASRSVEQEDGGRPRYGRRRSYGLFASNADLLKVY